MSNGHEYVGNWLKGKTQFMPLFEVGTDNGLNADCASHSYAEKYSDQLKARTLKVCDSHCH